MAFVKYHLVYNGIYDNISKENFKGKNGRLQGGHFQSSRCDKLLKRVNSFWK